MKRTIHTPKVADIWHLHSDIYDKYVLLTEEIHSMGMKFLGESYTIFKAIDLSTGQVCDAHFRHMEIWTKVA